MLAFHFFTSTPRRGNYTRVTSGWFSQVKTRASYTRKNFAKPQNAHRQEPNGVRGTSPQIWRNPLATKHLYTLRSLLESTCVDPITSNKKLPGAPGLTRSTDATRGRPGIATNGARSYERNSRSSLTELQEMRRTPTQPWTVSTTVRGRWRSSFGPHLCLGQWPELPNDRKGINEARQHMPCVCFEARTKKSPDSPDTTRRPSRQSE